jgi:hypothetical protein
MQAKKKAAEKVEKPKVRIPKGSMSCGYDSIATVIECLMFKGFRLEDLSKTSIETDYSGCYYESDEPRICVEWNDIL